MTGRPEDDPDRFRPPEFTSSEQFEEFAKEFPLPEVASVGLGEAVWWITHGKRRRKIEYDDEYGFGSVGWNQFPHHLVEFLKGNIDEFDSVDADLILDEDQHRALCRWFQANPLDWHRVYVICDALEREISSWRRAEPMVAQAAAEGRIDLHGVLGQQDIHAAIPGARFFGRFRFHYLDNDSHLECLFPRHETWSDVQILRSDVLKLRSEFLARVVDGNRREPSRIGEGPLRRWYVERVRKWPLGQKPPTEKEDLDAAKSELGSVSRQQIRPLRKKEAPPHWTARGRPPKSRN